MSDARGNGVVGREMVSLEWPMVVRAEAKYSTRTDGVPSENVDSVRKRVTTDVKDRVVCAQ